MYLDAATANEQRSLSCASSGNLCSPAKHTIAAHWLDAVRELQEQQDSNKQDSDSNPKETSPAHEPDVNEGEQAGSGMMAKVQSTMQKLGLSS